MGVKPERPLLLANPGAREGDSQVEATIAALAQRGIQPARVEVQDAGQFTPLIRAAGPEIDSVIVAGGDGSLNASLSGLLDRKLPLGIIPLGTANNVARTLGIPDLCDSAAAVIAAGGRRTIDVGVANDRFFLTTASLGLSVEITGAMSSATKARFGIVAYALTALKVVLGATPMHAVIVADGERRKSRTVQIVVGNGRYYGGGLQVAHDAQIDDARLDLYSLEVSHWWSLVGLIPRLRSGRLHESAQTLTLRASTIEISTRECVRLDLDGEVGGATPVTFGMRRQSLQVFAGDPPAN